MIHNLRERAGQQIFLVGQHSVADCQRQIQRFIGMTKEKLDGRNTSQENKMAFEKSRNVFKCLILKKGMVIVAIAD